MSKVKEPTTKYSVTVQTHSAEMLLQEIQELPKEVISDVMKYIQSLRMKTTGKKMDKHALRSYVGKIKLAIDPKKFQKAIRDEWE
ncbi:MAG: hypothetical protein FJ218_06205 [Ignavibacteria bacterium]|nr:hypothetical protein [Ignavibacteria bacterium]